MWSYCLILRDEHKSTDEVKENCLLSPCPPPSQLLGIFFIEEIVPVCPSKSLHFHEKK